MLLPEGTPLSRGQKRWAIKNRFPVFTGALAEKDDEDRRENHIFRPEDHYLLPDHRGFSTDHGGLFRMLGGFSTDHGDDPLKEHNHSTDHHHDLLKNHVLSSEDGGFQNYLSGFLDEKCGFPSGNSDYMDGANEKL